MPQATASVGLAQGRYVAARSGFKPATLQTIVAESVNEPPQSWHHIKLNPPTSHFVTFSWISPTLESDVIIQIIYLLMCVCTGDADCDFSDEERKSIDEMIHALVGFLKSQIAFYMQHVSASHVLRVLIEVLSGCQVSDRIIRGNNSQRREAKSKLIFIQKKIRLCGWMFWCDARAQN